MLVLTRKLNEKIVIASDIVVTVVNIDGDQVRIGIDAPRDISIHRQEIFDEIVRSNRAALLESGSRNDVLLGLLKRNREQ